MLRFEIFDDIKALFSHCVGRTGVKLQIGNNLSWEMHSKWKIYLGEHF